MRLCIQWPTFGPYHVARFVAAQEVLQLEDIEVVGLETSAADITGRTREAGEQPIVTVFEGMRFKDLAPADVHTRLQAALSRIDPDVVAITSYSFPDAQACIRWCLKNRRGMVLMSASRREDAPRTWWRENVKRSIVSQFGAAVVGGTPQRRYIRDLGLTDNVIFDGYDVVDNEFFSTGADQSRSNPEAFAQLPGLGAGGPFFLASGRMIARKDYPTMLAGYRAYRASSGEPWRLVILGDGDHRPAIETMIRDLGIEGVTLAGWQSNENLPSYYGLAGAFVHTASVDQWGLVVNEAMAAGLPVVVSEGAGCVEDLVMNKGTGLSFPPGDVEKLADCLASVSSDDRARSAMATRARQVISDWTPTRFGKSMREAAALASRRRHSVSISARLILKMLRTTSRELTSFHSVEA